MRFTHPEPAPASVRIWPVFLPFAGCPYRCVFCAQDKQTGRDHVDLAVILDTLEGDLYSAFEQGRGPYELAFYGGTFTALPKPWPERFLDLAARFRERGLITRVRCSTRPDCVAPDGLTRLSSFGLDMVELGIQSFDDEALRTSGRGYSGETALAACDMVRDSGLGLGIQLLPGLSGDRPGLFQADVRIAAALSPETARLYPCLVVRGTPLADLWERGGYVPWTTDRAVRELAEALRVLWAKGVRVIRLGLAPEPTLDENILAGPHHPALGQSARALALFEVVKGKVRELGQPPSLLEVPRRYSGEFFGHARELAPAYFELGFIEGTIRFAEAEVFFLK
jgi:histone acetyltransferase (RNA polymerase elongator complex component)